MTNIIDYALWRGDLPCTLVGLCPVDFLVFAQLIHAPLERLEGMGEGRPLNELTAAVYPQAPGKDENALVHSRYELWNAMKAGARFGDATLKRFAAHFEPICRRPVCNRRRHGRCGLSRHGRHPCWLEGGL